MTIPKVVQTELMPNNVPISVIFSVFWKGNGDISYMNIVYELTLVVDVDVVLKYSQFNTNDPS